MMFSVCMWMFIGYVIRKWYELSVDNVLMLGGFLLGFGAWNAVQIRKDQKQNLETYKEVVNGKPE